MTSLRTDAARNRAALVAAAREVMAERGLEAPLDEIARRAGIGNATLYRRFPRRVDLIAAVFADRMADHARVDCAISPTHADGHARTQPASRPPRPTEPDHLSPPEGALMKAVATTDFGAPA